MLKRPEIGTREHVLLWLASKPADEKFDWPACGHCAAGQYSEEFYGCRHGWGKHDVVVELNQIAFPLSRAGVGYRRVKWGDLYDAARRAWAGGG